MGLLSASASFVRYSVSGDTPENFWDFAAERIRMFSFKDIDDSFEEQSIGWVSIHNMFDSEFSYASYAAGDYIVLSLRFDERKASSAALKKFAAKEEERIKKEKQVPRLSRGHRQEIRENMRLMLLKKAVPIPSVYDMAWNLADGTVLFFSTNLKAQELLEHFFKETFGMQLTLQIPYLTAQHLLPTEREDDLAAIGPEIFI